MTPVDAASADNTSRQRWSLAAVLLLAAALRLIGIFVFPSLAHPDENFQLFEQAHRLAFGYGIKPWEFSDAARSMVVPYVLSGLFRLTEPLFGGPEGYVRATQTSIAAASLIPVALVYQMGLRTSRTHALLAGLVAASWYEIVYFSFRPLTEALACDAVVAALALASPRERELTPRRLAVIGAALTLALALRVQLLPGLAFVGLCLGGARFRRRWLPMAAGAIPVLAVFGGADWLSWGAPFASYVNTVRINLAEHKASIYGVQPAWWYLLLIAGGWGASFPAMIVLIGLRAARSAPWIIFAVIEIAAHSLIPHKEYRFVYPAIACLVIAAAMGSADLATTARLPEPVKSLLIAAVGLAWLGGSLSTAASPLLVSRWFQARGVMEASFLAARQPHLCGLLYASDPWWQTGGYTFLHRQTPIYDMTGPHGALLSPTLATQGAPAFNAAIVKPSQMTAFRGYRPMGCFGQRKAWGRCLIMRAGECRRVSTLAPLLTRPRLGE